MNLVITYGDGTKLSRYYQNGLILNTNLQELYLNINYDIIAITETWLTDHIDNNEFIFQCCNSIYRIDRNRVLSG